MGREGHHLICTEPLGIQQVEAPKGREEDGEEEENNKENTVMMVRGFFLAERHLCTVRYIFF